jgi:LPS sulfotransferase NodH
VNRQFREVERFGNIIVLTTGLSGSSVITGLLASQGFWAGDETCFKDNSTGRYETFENSRLVELNEKLVDSWGIRFGPKTWYEAKAENAISIGSIERQVFENFISECRQHSPWIWKDPKMWVTFLPIWSELLKGDVYRCVLIKRRPLNLWISQVQKRIIYDYFYLKSAEQKGFEELEEALDRAGIAYIRVDYENLIARPEGEIKRLNQFLSLNISMEDWCKLYKENKESARYWLNLLKACLIYLKNYTNRIR